MADITWDEVGKRTFETGVDRGVLYLPDVAGNYVNGVAWNGLTSVSESPSGAEPNAQYADNIKYLNLVSREEFEATLEAFTYPAEFAQFDGGAELQPGVMVGLESEKQGIERAGARLMMAVCDSQMPWITVVVGQLFGVGGACHVSGRPSPRSWTTMPSRIW